MTKPARIALLVSALLLGVDLLAVAHSAVRARSTDARDARAVVRLVGTADLALSSNARWLRHPSMAEPSAAVSDHPATLDTEPAGALLGPVRP